MKLNLDVNERNDLLEKFRKCIEMCARDGYKISPSSCVKYMGRVQFTMPTFNQLPERYEFALALIEGKPVFTGDILYFEGKDYVAREILYNGSLRLTRNVDELVIPVLIIDKDKLNLLSRNPFKKKHMFMLNGEELPCPENKSREDTYNIILFDEEYGFATECDRDKVIGSLKKLLEDAKSNE